MAIFRVVNRMAAAGQRNHRDDFPPISLHTYYLTSNGVDIPFEIKTLYVDFVFNFVSRFHAIDWWRVDLSNGMDRPGHCHCAHGTDQCAQCGTGCRSGVVRLAQVVRRILDNRMHWWLRPGRQLHLRIYLHHTSGWSCPLYASGQRSATSSTRRMASRRRGPVHQAHPSTPVTISAYGPTPISSPGPLFCPPMAPQLCPHTVTIDSYGIRQSASHCRHFDHHLKSLIPHHGAPERSWGYRVNGSPLKGRTSSRLPDGFHVLRNGDATPERTRSPFQRWLSCRAPQSIRGRLGPEG